MDDSQKNGTATQNSIPGRHARMRLLALRKAYLAGELKVDSARVAGKLLAFENTLEMALSEQIHQKDKTADRCHR